ncbi:MAG: hypothetical protein ISR61_09815 [Desulfobacteraceae bacterium]|uniref:Uncharacterized protein n=1 Tax=Candidatus Desulfacyla euxinica TaxID=2841693 RepID=A0A8J6T4X9_9DELT|nr:hypothetical protein [Candidatus Desulfacyla euxinica]MBL6979236.1 hypothetical protein [Desulfobacteraceae bacterium]
MANTPTKPVLASPRTAEKLLDIYFLDMRSALLETAATLDRIERAENGSDIFRDPRIGKLVEACEILKDGKKNRAEQFLVLFSDPLE